MSLSKRSLETLLDLVEIKLSCMEVWDREDRRELQSLELARRELQAVAGLAVSEATEAPRKRGRTEPERSGLAQRGVC